MATLETVLRLDRCPHCRVDTPNLVTFSNRQTTDSNGGNKRLWVMYQCSRCGGVVTASAREQGGEVLEIYPSAVEVDIAVPDRARAYLNQALQTLHAPAGSIMLSASAVDAMLKERSLQTGSLNERINQAAANHLITAEMAQWAHDVRLDANDQRHADENAPLPDSADAQRAVEFAQALAQFLFVLPARVRRGMRATQQAAPRTP